MHLVSSRVRTSVSAAAVLRSQWTGCQAVKYVKCSWKHMRIKNIGDHLKPQLFPNSDHLEDLEEIDLGSGDEVVFFFRFYADAPPLQGLFVRKHRFCIESCCRFVISMRKSSETWSLSRDQESGFPRSLVRG
jgi:hypothetical protein